MSELYVLSDAKFTPLNTLFDSVKKLLESGVKFIQYRNKFSSFIKFNPQNSDFSQSFLQDNKFSQVLNDEQKNELEILRKIAQICTKFKAKFIINDNPFLAQICNAHGVHIGKDDTDFLNARKILGNEKIIGVSCYDDLNLALKYQDLGADYVAFGAVFPSKTKPNASCCQISTIKKAKELINTKIAIIGGINASNLNQISSLNVDYIAIVSAAYKPYSIAQNISNLHQILRK